MRVVAVINHKGGVGKTTFTGCTAQALALTGFRVLAIDNDSQHNLSTMLGTGIQQPNISDVYRSQSPAAPATLLRSVRATGINGLHVITSQQDLCDADVQHEQFLSVCFQTCALERFYDIVLIDNAPGLGRLQAAAIGASSEIFVPTELRQFAVDGIVEMDRLIGARFPGGPKVTKIIPNFFRDVKRHAAFIAALNRLFPGRVTATAIPLDPVFDELITEGKILFLHRLYSKGAAYYLKLIHELFDLGEEQLWDQVVHKRKERMREDARQRFTERREGVRPL